MNQKVQSALTGLAVAVLAALVAFGVIGGNEADAIQGVVVAAITFAAAVFVRSARPPRDRGE